MITCEGILTNNNFNKQLFNLEKIIKGIQCNKSYKNTLKKKRFNNKKSIKKQHIRSILKKESKYN